MVKRLMAIFIFTFLVIGVVIKHKPPKEVPKFEKNNIRYSYSAEGEYLKVYDGETFNSLFLKGVNIGAAKPGYFPGELGISKEEYKRWFKQIKDMNANVIRVYTILKPEFYEALFEFNKNNEDPLFLLHGVWVNEENINEKLNAFDPLIQHTLLEDTTKLIDVIHGNSEIEEKSGEASGKYLYDVSDYVIGWILGIEWDPIFVTNTNDLNKDRDKYEGKYLYTKQASPFENFLCELGEIAIKYETETYSKQRPVSFTNWVTTDTIEHTNEPMQKEDLVAVNTEHIKVKDSFYPGLFASYHVYPYYPDFMSYQDEYISYIDERGNVNPYKAYLQDLKKEHTVPVVIAEFGIPASRGKTHENIHTGFNQGNIDEVTQGRMNASMLQDIYNTNYAGGLIFTWQDEWFKRTWNTMDYSIPDRRAYWSNTETNEQEFGILAFDPGKKKSITYVDGNIDEWKRRTPLISKDDLYMSVNSDEKYLYLMINSKKAEVDFLKENIVIPLDITNNSGSKIYNEYNFDRDVDFVIDVNGKDKCRIFVHSYYDSFYFTYGNQLKMIEKVEGFENPHNNIFNPIYLCLNKELQLPETGETIPFNKYETGKLVHGNSNPSSENYYSLADYYVTEDIIELRIPWALLNFMDPSHKYIMNDFYRFGIQPMEIEDIWIGAYIGDKVYLPMDNYNWGKWDVPIYHERLKKSYYILKEAMGNMKL